MRIKVFTVLISVFNLTSFSTILKLFYESINIFTKLYFGSYALNIKTTIE